MVVLVQIMAWRRTDDKPLSEAVLVWCTETYIIIYIYIKRTVFVNVATNRAQHAHARMIAIIAITCIPVQYHHGAECIWLESGLFRQLYIYICMSYISVTETKWWRDNIFSANGLVRSGHSHYLKQSWPRPIRHMTSLEQYIPIIMKAVT